jgi:hypothetical protein
MYYAEKIINGILCCKFSPTDEWKPVSLEIATKRIIELMDKVKALETELEMCMQGDR